MDDKIEALKEKLDRLIREAAETAADLQAAERGTRGPVHFSLIEAATHAVGCALSTGIQERVVREAVADAVRYLTNNRQRMDYPRYRREGLPVTSALMESLVKEMNCRVKGTEMFWNDPSGAEAILQVRAAALCDDDRLARHLATRPGCSRVRRPLAAAA
jgi:hypothetical protein